MREDEKCEWCGEYCIKAFCLEQLSQTREKDEKLGREFSKMSEGNFVFEKYGGLDENY